MTDTAASVSTRRRRRQEARAWQAAESFAELCELTAQWIEGNMVYQPGYGAEQVDAETVPLVEVLVRANRAGFLTDDSQPGDAGDNAYGHSGLPWRQRAYVCGWIVSRALLGRIRAGCVRDGLWMTTDPAVFGNHTGSVHLAEVDGTPRRLYVVKAPNLQRAPDVRFQNQAAVHAVEQAVWVTLLDPDFDGGDRLWRMLAEAIANGRPDPSRPPAVGYVNGPGLSRRTVAAPRRSEIVADPLPSSIQDSP